MSPCSNKEYLRFFYNVLRYEYFYSHLNCSSIVECICIDALEFLGTNGERLGQRFYGSVWHHDSDAPNVFNPQVSRLVQA
jgi:hypothetical protein